MCSRPQFTDLTYMGGNGLWLPMTIIFGSVIQSQYTGLTFHVLKTPVYQFDLYGRYRTLRTDYNNFWQCYLELVYKPKYQIWCESDFPCAQDHRDRFDLYGRFQKLLTDDDNFWQCYLELLYKTKYQIWCESDFPCAQDQSYRFDLYGRYQILWTDDDNFGQCYLELVYKPEYQICCEPDFPCAQDPSLPI